MATPGVYVKGGSELPKSYSHITPKNRPTDFSEPRGTIVEARVSSKPNSNPNPSIVEAYLSSQEKFMREVSEVFNVDSCAGGVWVFAEKPASPEKGDEL